VSRRKPLPHEDAVKAIRERVAHGNMLARIHISDDSDMWAVGRGEESPINYFASVACAAFDEARALGQKLLELGESAAPAVATGLRTTGSWRENLLPFAARHRDLPVIRESLELIAKRQRDPLSERAMDLLGGREFRQGALPGSGWR
jgi:hypothetical protein